VFHGSILLYANELRLSKASAGFVDAGIALLALGTGEVSRMERASQRILTGFGILVSGRIAQQRLRAEAKEL
jgi:hypothetical protein